MAIKTFSKELILDWTTLHYYTVPKAFTLIQCQKINTNENSLYILHKSYLYKIIRFCKVLHIKIVNFCITHVYRILNTTNIMKARFIMKNSMSKFKSFKFSFISRILSRLSHNSGQLVAINIFTSHLQLDNFFKWWLARRLTARAHVIIFSEWRTWVLRQVQVFNTASYTYCTAAWSWNHRSSIVTTSMFYIATRETRTFLT